MDPGVFWTEVGSLAQAVAALFALLAVLYSVWAFREQVRIQNYTAIDNMYMELLQTALERTHLREVDLKRTPEQQAEYDIYAFMVWNFLEAVYDLCSQDAYLRETWYPIIHAESRLHRQWFDDPRHHHKFKGRFAAFIRKEDYTP